jgi:hypothetical protein
MNPNADRMNSLPIPPSGAEMVRVGGEQIPGQQIEAMPGMSVERSSGPGAPVWPLPAQDNAGPVLSPPAMAAGLTADDIQPGSGTSIAEDSDLIEKEWVLKAKQIIHGTVNDPYRQNQQLNLLKADYMQKRYNKTIKLS